MSSYNITILILFVIIFINFSTSEAQDTSTYVSKNCSSNSTTTSNSAFQLHLKDFLKFLWSNVTGRSQFYFGGMRDNKVPSDSFFFSFMCRVDIPSQPCHQCVTNATRKLSSECS